jgi:hypothetical protein
MTRTDIIGNVSDDRNGDATWTLACSLVVCSVKVESHVYDRVRFVDPSKVIEMKELGSLAVGFISCRHKRVCAAGSRLTELI